MISKMHEKISWVDGNVLYQLLGDYYKVYIIIKTPN